MAAIRSLVDLLENILSTQNPPAFQVPIPPAGPYRDALTSVARFYKRNSLGTRLNTRGSYVDEMFIFTAHLEEFEHSMDGVLFCAGSLDGLWLIHDNYPSSIPLFYIVWDTLRNLT